MQIPFQEYSEKNIQPQLPPIFDNFQSRTGIQDFKTTLGSGSNRLEKSVTITHLLYPCYITSTAKFRRNRTRLVDVPR